MPFMGRRTTQGAEAIGVDDIDDDDITREMRRVGMDVLEGLVRQPGSMRGTRPLSSFTSTRVFSP
jgi:hypothetical protein